MITSAASAGGTQHAWVAWAFFDVADGQAEQVATGELPPTVGELIPDRYVVQCVTCDTKWSAAAAITSCTGRARPAYKASRNSRCHICGQKLKRCTCGKPEAGS